MVLVVMGSYFLYGTSHLILGLVFTLSGTTIILVLMRKVGSTGLVVLRVVFIVSTIVSFYEKFVPK